MTTCKHYLLAVAGIAVAPATVRAGGDCFGGMFDASYSDEYVAALMGWAMVVVVIVSRSFVGWRASLVTAAAVAAGIWYHLADSRAWLADLPVLAGLGLLSAVALVRLAVVAVRRVTEGGASHVEPAAKLSTGAKIGMVIVVAGGAFLMLAAG